MKIVAGLGSLDDFRALAEAGADEVFTGYVPGGWYEKYSDFLPLNRREVRLQSIQIDTLGDMRMLRSMAEDADVRVSVTFNSPVYAPEQYGAIGDLIADLHAVGYDRWIVADPGLMLALTAENAPGSFHLSGEAGAFTADAVAFFADRFPVSRCIFPRRTSIAEMAQCAARFPDMELEAFVLNENCRYSGAFCMSAHCDAFDAMCRVPYRASGPDLRKREQIAAEASRGPDGSACGAAEEFGAGGCGICALEALARAGVTHLKVVGRGARPELIRRDVRFLRRALNMPEVERIAEFSAGCAGNCYYPARNT